MSVNVSLKKIIIVICVLVVAAGSIWWLVFTKDVRIKKAEYKLLVRFAQRQAVEIAIIEQRSKLLNYQQQMNVASSQPKVAQPIKPNPPMPAPFMSAVEDPKDITE